MDAPRQTEPPPLSAKSLITGAGLILCAIGALAQTHAGTLSLVGAGLLLLLSAEAAERRIHAFIDAASARPDATSSSGPR